MSLPSADAKAIVRALEGLTAAVQRAAKTGQQDLVLSTDALAEAALREQLRTAIDPVLADCPEHNRRDEHEQILAEITTAVLGVIQPKES